jgi:hypothetical protein
MLTRRTLSTIVVSGCLFGSFACGGSDKPAKGSENVASQGAGGDAEKGAAGKAAKAEKPEADQDKPADTGMPPVTRTPKDIITAPDLLFVLSFSSSEIGEKTEAECAKKSKDDPKKTNQCAAKERKKIHNDVVGFSKDKNGKYWWLTARMQGSKLTTLHKIEIEFGEEKSDSIVIKPIGKDRGAKPWVNPPGKVKIGVPNEFSIVLDDPTYGKMVYEAKIGIAGGGSSEK